MSLADRFPRLRNRTLPDWVANAADDGDPVQAARASFEAAVDELEGQPTVLREVDRRADTWHSLHERHVKWNHPNLLCPWCGAA